MSKRAHGDCRGMTTGTMTTMAAGTIDLIVGIFLVLAVPP